MMVIYMAWIIETEMRYNFNLNSSVDFWVLNFENFWLSTPSGYQVGTGWSDSFFSSFPHFQNACVPCKFGVMCVKKLKEM